VLRAHRSFIRFLVERLLTLGTLNRLNFFNMVKTLAQGWSKRTLPFLGIFEWRLLRRATFALQVLLVVTILP